MSSIARSLRLQVDADSLTSLAPDHRPVRAIQRTIATTTPIRKAVRNWRGLLREDTQLPASNFPS